MTFKELKQLIEATEKDNPDIENYELRCYDEHEYYENLVWIDGKIITVDKDRKLITIDRYDDRLF